MTWPAEAPLMSPPQRLRAGLLRGCLRLLFRGLVRPPMPVALQRGVLRGLSLATLGAGGVVRERRSLAGVPCEWLRPRGVEARRRVLYLHGGAYLIGSPATHRAITTHLARLLLPADAEPGSAALSPLHADLAGLPPLLVQVGEDELLRDDSLRLAQRAGEQGVAVRLQRYAGCWHVFQAHAGVLASADRALDEAAAFVVECSAEGGQCRTS